VTSVEIVDTASVSDLLRTKGKVIVLGAGGYTALNCDLPRGLSRVLHVPSLIGKKFFLPTTNRIVVEVLNLPL
jgi:hypothetical protein